jgi:ribosomal RNA-processing protein 8
MSKKKKSKGESKQSLRRKQRVKGVKRHDKKNIKQFVGLAKIKNKQNIKGNVSKFKTKSNAKDNAVDNKIINSIRKSKGNEKGISKHSGIMKHTSAVKKLNINKINAMLNANKSEVSYKKKDKLKAPMSLRERMLSHLKASRFRFLNEQMYTSKSAENKIYFQNDPQAFHAYHEGYKQQVSRWPMNPLNVIIESISKLYV